MQNSGKELFESTIAKQAGDDGAELVLFDDHDGLKRALPPMATVIYGDITWTLTQPPTQPHTPSHHPTLVPLTPNPNP